MSGITFPINPALAAKAFKLSNSGLKGKAIAEAMGKGITTDAANLLAAVGHYDFIDDAAKLTDNEVRVLVALLDLQRQRRRSGETSSPKAWMLCRSTGLSEGQIRRATKRIGEPDFENRARWNLLCHSRNGHIWLKPAGIAVARELSRPREAGAPC